LLDVLDEPEGESLFRFTVLADAAGDRQSRQIDELDLLDYKP